MKPTGQKSHRYRQKDGEDTLTNRPFSKKYIFLVEKHVKVLSMTCHYHEQALFCCINSLFRTRKQSPIEMSRNLIGHGVFFRSPLYYISQLTISWLTVGFIKASIQILKLKLAIISHNYQNRINQIICDQQSYLYK